MVKVIWKDGTEEIFSTTVSYEIDGNEVSLEDSDEGCIAVVNFNEIRYISD